MFRNPNLAAQPTRRSPRAGRDAFYRGPIAEQIVAFSENERRLLHAEGFRGPHVATGSSRSRPTIAATTSGSCRPTARGSPRLQMLNILEGYDLSAMGRAQPRLPAPVHRGQEAGLRRSGQVLRRPGLRQAAVAELISKEYAAQRRKLIDLAARGRHPSIRAIRCLARRATRFICASSTRTATAARSSRATSAGFGSQVVPGDVGFVMQNRGSQLFASTDKHLNRLEPHKRPFHTIIPAMVTKDGKPWLVLRRDGRRHAAAGARAGARQHDRLRHERAGSRRRRPRAPRRLADADRRADGPRRRQGRRRIEHLRRPRSTSSHAAATTSSTHAATASAATRASGSTRNTARCTAPPSPGKTARRSGIEKNAVSKTMNNVLPYQRDRAQKNLT